jgi:protein TonB
MSFTRLSICAALLTLSCLATAQARPARVRVSQGVMKQLLVTQVPPQYPEEAHKNHISGTVLLKAIISPEGDVKALTLISGDPMVVPAATEAAKQWKYKPYLLNGQPVEVETQIQINFTLVGP